LFSDIDHISSQVPVCSQKFIFFEVLSYTLTHLGPENTLWGGNKAKVLSPYNGSIVCRTPSTVPGKIERVLKILAVAVFW
jgi:hypothetical protein